MTHMARRSFLATAGAAVTGLAVGCSDGSDGTARTPAPLPSATTPGTSGAPAPRAGGAPGTPRDLVTGLAVPWAIAFLPSGDALVTERDTARLLRVTPRGRAGEVGKVPGVRPEGEGGLLGVAVSPAFERDSLVFLYFSAADDNRVVRFRYDESGGIGSPQPIVTGIPKGGIHNGGRLAFGPDKMLYITTGEIGTGSIAQDRDSLAGKILRVTAEGRPAPGNPFGTRVWSYGHRNVQGLAWDDRERLFATEFGQDRLDEINRIEKGQNYGWPEVEGVGRRGRFIDPLLTWTTEEASPSGLAYAGGSLWAAALRGRRLWQVPVNETNGEVGRPVARLAGEFGRLRAVVRAPDGVIWISTSNRDGRGDPDAKDDRIIVLPLR